MSGGRPEDADQLDKLKNLNIQGRLGLVKLGSISEIAIEQGPLSISHFDLERSASISGDIIAEDTQAIDKKVDAAIAALDLPSGVSVNSGGIFEQIEEGFQDVITAMIIGVILVYLVMVASLGSLRDPFIIVLSLPLAIVGALVALAVTDKTLSLSAMMGFLLLIGVVVTNAIVLITFVEQLRDRGMGVYDALMEGGRTRVRPILMTAFTTTFALIPLAVSPGRRRRNNWARAGNGGHRRFSQLHLPYSSCGPRTLYLVSRFHTRFGRRDSKSSAGPRSRGKSGVR